MITQQGIVCRGQIMPDYAGGSIVNLMSTIQKACGIKNTQYKDLCGLSNIESKNILLMVIDGLGFEYLVKQGKGYHMLKHLKGSMTSVFPSTTSTATMAFLTGLPAQQSAITGWYMYMKEIATMVVPLRAETRSLGAPLPDELVSYLFSSNLLKRFSRKTFKFMPEQICSTPVSKALGGRTIIGYSSLNNLLAQLENVLSGRGKKYLYVYLQEFDKLEHRFGPCSEQVLAYFKKLDRFISRLTRQTRQTTLIITSDHGQVDTPYSKTVLLWEHPVLQDCLTLPLSGEPRAAYCYVKPSKANQFESYVKKKLCNSFAMFRSEVLLEQSIFGLGKPHPLLKDRIGDYVLIAKGNHSIKDAVIDRPVHLHLGNHGGLSTTEMLVPLIVIRKS